MTKFGSLITTDIPVLINFYKNGNDSLTVLKEVASFLGLKARIIKIDIAKNELLADALKIKGELTYVIYKDGMMKWRQTGALNSETLIQTLQQFI